MQGYLERLKNYAMHIEICGEVRNSYCKTDHDATFMRIKSDYMGNDQLLPAYNMQAAICDEYRSECCKKSVGNRTARLNRELTSFHQEVIDNLESIHGALLCMNRSIQSEGTFGIIKWDRSYKRLFRRGEKSVILEFTLISCGFNLYKYHNKKKRQQKAA